MVKALLETHDLRQQALVGPVFPTKGIASEVLSGKRKLTYDFVERLARFFQVSPEIFFSDRWFRSATVRSWVRQGNEDTR